MEKNEALQVSGAGSWVGRDPVGASSCACRDVPMSHWRFRVTREPTMSGPGDPSGMCLSAVCRSLRGWNVAWAPGFLFPPAVFPRLPLCWNVRSLGRFLVRTSSSLSNKFQLEPGGSSHVGMEATREGNRSARPVGTAMFLDLRLVDFQP